MADSTLTALTAGTTPDGTELLYSVQSSADVKLTTAQLRKNTAALGYATGAGGTVSQTTSRSTGVTINKLCGAITTHTASLATSTSATFTVTNSQVIATDVVHLNIVSGQTNKETRVGVSAVAAGTFDITMVNQSISTAEVGAAVINFAVIKGVTA